MSSAPFLNFIDGEFVPASSGDFFPKLNPFTGESLGDVAASDAMDVIRAIQFAKKALLDYEKWNLEQRAELLRKIADKLTEKAHELAFQEALHQGLPQEFVLKKSVQFAALQFQNAANQVDHQARQHPASVFVQPTGLVSLVISWNLSLRLLSERLAPALAAGNVCLIKVSELSPVTAAVIGKILQEVQAPKGLVQFIHGKGPEVGALLTAHPSIRAVNFVGRLSTAEKVIGASIPQLKKVQIYAGAKNSSLILADVDFKSQMPEILESFLLGQGQLCWNTTRLFILESQQKEFAISLQEYLSRLRPNQSPADSGPWTPLINPEIKALMPGKSGQIPAEQGKLLFGGQALDQAGFFFQPTVSLDLPNCSELQQEELRGPLLIVTAVKYQHEMVKWANTGYYGHSAIVWGAEEKARKLAEKLDFGTVSVNSWLGSESRPGHRQSSYGNLDVGPWGSFYSDVKVLTGSLG